MLIKRIDKWVNLAVEAANVEFEERRCGSDRRKCPDRRCEQRLGGESDRRQGGERRKYPLLQRILH